jgi:hypothetical protein
MHRGSPATLGSGPEQYTIRLVFEMSSFDTFDLVSVPFVLGGHDATIRPQATFTYCA